MNGQVARMRNVAQISPGIWAGFTDAATGNLAFHVGDEAAAVAARRTALNHELAALLGTDVNLAYMNQVHGSTVAHVGGDHRPARINPAVDVPTADALVAAGGPAAGRGLAVMVADCVPVVLGGHSSLGEPVVAVAHAGRQGVELNVVAAVVAQMRAAGARNIAAQLGPSVCGGCYEVPAALRRSVGARVPEAFATTSWGTPALDLPAAVTAQLAQLGIGAVGPQACTMEDPRWFSHRRSQRGAWPEGRFIGFVAAAPHARPIRQDNLGSTDPGGLFPS